MSKEWQKIEAAVKKLQPALKKFDPARADRLIAQIKAALERAWKAEDGLAAAHEAALKAGLSGKKPADFIADKGFKTALATFRQETAQHVAEVKALTGFTKEAAGPHKALRPLMGDMKKHLDKRDKDQVRFQAGVKKDFERIEHCAQAMGRLTAAETFYGSHFDKVVDRVINKGARPAVSQDAKQLIEPKQRDRNVKQAVKLAQNVAKLCNAASKKAASDPRSAAPYLKKAAALSDELKTLAKAYLNLKKKNGALIKASADAARTVKAIATISRAHDVSARRYGDTLAEIRALVG